MFFYDFSSPYAYLSAHRVDNVLPIRPSWQPIVFGALMGAIGKKSWALRKGPARNAQMRECEKRAGALGLPLRWPPDWPFGTSYSTLVVRAAFVASEHGKVREFSRAAFKVGLGHGRDLRDLDVILEAAAEVELDPVAVRCGVETSRVKRRVREVTAKAIKLGVTGVPTVIVGDELFWGDDRLEDAARIVGTPAPSAAATIPGRSAASSRADYRGASPLKSVTGTLPRPGLGDTNVSRESASTTRGPDV
jgi:2-hydroxychromene-2-carboxylate isomerase